MPSPAASVATQIWRDVRKSSWARFRSWGFMPPWIWQVEVAPAGQVVEQVVQGIAVFGENKQSAPAIFQFTEFSFRQAIAQRGEFGIRGMIAHAARLRQQITKRRNFGPQLVKFNRRGELVCQQVAFGIVEIVFILLGVGDSALNLGKPLCALRRRKGFQLLQQLLLLLRATANGFGDGLRRTGETPLENSARQRHTLLLAPARLRQELVDVGGNCLVEVELFLIQPELDRVGVAVREETLAVNVAEIFLQAAERPRAVFSEAENVASNLARPQP